MFDLRPIPGNRFKELMTANQGECRLVTVPENVDLDEAKRLLHQHRIEKLVVVDDSIDVSD